VIAPNSHRAHFLAGYLRLKLIQHSVHPPDSGTFLRHVWLVIDRDLLANELEILAMASSTMLAL